MLAVIIRSIITITKDRNGENVPSFMDVHSAAVLERAWKVPGSIFIFFLFPLLSFKTKAPCYSSKKSPYLSF